MGFKVRVCENDNFIIFVHYKNANLWKLLDWTCFSLKSEIGNYRPGMHNTAFLVCVYRDNFDNSEELRQCKKEKLFRF